MPFFNLELFSYIDLIIVLRGAVKFLFCFIPSMLHHQYHLQLVLSCGSSPLKIFNESPGTHHIHRINTQQIYFCQGILVNKLTLFFLASTGFLAGAFFLGLVAAGAFFAFCFLSAEPATLNAPNPPLFIFFVPWRPPIPAAFACSLVRVGPFVMGMMLRAVLRCCCWFEGANADAYATSKTTLNLSREENIFLINIWR